MDPRWDEKRHALYIAYLPMYSVCAVISRVNHSDNSREMIILDRGKIRIPLNVVVSGFHGSENEK